MYSEPFCQIRNCTVASANASFSSLHSLRSRRSVCDRPPSGHGSDRSMPALPASTNRSRQFPTIADETPCRRAASASDDLPFNTANTTWICSSTACSRWPPEQGGNPFLLVELLGGLRDEAAVELADGHARLVSELLPQLPQRVQAFARSHLDLLSPQAQRLIQVAAVLGNSFSVDDLAELLGEPANQLLSALEEALAAQIVVASDNVLFRHHLLWQAVTDSLPRPIHRWLHLQAGEMLLERGGSAVPAGSRPHGRFRPRPIRPYGHRGRCPDGRRTAVRVRRPRAYRAKPRIAQTGRPPLCPWP